VVRCCATNQYADISRQFYTNRLLFGDLADSGTVATEIASGTQVEVFKHTDGKLTRERRPLKLFALGANRELFAGLRAGQKTVELAGDFRFRYLAEFSSTEGLDAARLHLRNITGKGPGAPDAPYLILADPIEQHLMLTGGTSFTQMQFADLHRMQIALEVYVSAGFEFPMAAREGDRIIAMALTDSQGFASVLSGREMDERTMLLELVRIIHERDPDVIEGHNLFRFILEYLEARARRHKVKLALGRNDSVLRGRASRMQIAERTIAYRRYEAYGRSLIDTWLLAQH
jgi:DNA polymerase, archaea type